MLASKKALIFCLFFQSFFFFSFVEINKLHDAHGDRQEKLQPTAVRETGALGVFGVQLGVLLEPLEHHSTMVLNGPHYAERREPLR